MNPITNLYPTDRDQADVLALTDIGAFVLDTDGSDCRVCRATTTVTIWRPDCAVSLPCPACAPTPWPPSFREFAMTPRPDIGPVTARAPFALLIVGPDLYPLITSDQERCSICRDTGTIPITNPDCWDPLSRALTPTSEWVFIPPCPGCRAEAFLTWNGWSS